MWQLHTASVSTAVIEQPLAKERLISDWYRLIHYGRTPHHGHCQKQRCVLVDLFCRRAEALLASTTTDIQKKVEGLRTDAERALFSDISAAPQPTPKPATK